MVERLFLAVPRGCLQFVIVVFPDHTHLLFLVLPSKIYRGTLVPVDTFFSESQTCQSESIPSMTGRCFKLSDTTDNFIHNSVDPFLRATC